LQAGRRGHERWQDRPRGDSQRRLGHGRWACLLPGGGWG